MADLRGTAARLTAFQLNALKIMYGAVDWALVIEDGPAPEHSNMYALYALIEAGYVEGKRVTVRPRLVGTDGSEYTSLLAHNATALNLSDSGKKLWDLARTRV
jgi:hypothetical protein